MSDIDKHIWVDADACPNPVKTILFRAAVRAGVHVTLVANRAVNVPPSPYINTLQVSRHFDAADNEIVGRLGAGHLVVTQDIPLAAAVLERNAFAVTPRGEPFTKATIGERLKMRELMESLRSSGIMTGGPSMFDHADRKSFARQLDIYLAGNWIDP